MRTEKSIKNIFSSMIGQFFGILINLLTRAVFVKTLASDYLGLDGLLSNILMILSLVELGVGPAMTYTLYKPLAKKDKEKIKTLINVYKKLYTSIGIIILVIGLVFMPFLSFFINDAGNIDNLYIIYILYLVNSCISYFYSYKSSILTTDQKKYIYNMYHYSIMILYNLFQIFVLLLYKNYIFYLVVQIIFVLLENILLVKKTDKLYPYLKEKNVDKLPESEQKSLNKNIKAMVFHKFGSVVINATDNIILSKVVGLTAVALYSNYCLITNNLKKIITQIFDSVIASIGNLVAEGNSKKTIEVFYKMFFFNFWIYTLVCVILFSVFNDFITIWVGKKYLFSNALVFVVTLNFFLSGMRKTVLAFRDAMGLYWHDRYKPLFESSINIVTSIVLGLKFGVIGVFLGTLISNVLTNLWVEPFVLFKHGFHQNVMQYYKKFVLYTGAYLSITLFFHWSLNVLFPHPTILTLLVKGLITFICTNLILILFNRNNENYIYFKNILFKILKKRRI